MENLSARQLRPCGN
jgi:hypothetical protein